MHNAGNVIHNIHRLVLKQILIIMITQSLYFAIKYSHKMKGTEVLTLSTH